MKSVTVLDQEEDCRSRASTDVSQHVSVGQQQLLSIETPSEFQSNNSPLLTIQSDRVILEVTGESPQHPLASTSEEEEPAATDGNHLRSRLDAECEMQAIWAGSSEIPDPVLVRPSMKLPAATFSSAPRKT
jgi:hypothetical protein